MNKPYDTYKNIFKRVEENLKEIRDKVDCLQRSRVYIHNHITKVENDISELKKLLPYRHAPFKAYEVRRDEHSESYELQIAEVN